MHSKVKLLTFNYAGLKLRKKSQVHADIISERTGRRNKNIKSVVRHQLDLLGNSEHWGFKGVSIDINCKGLIIKDIFDIAQTKKSITAMVLGPGKGAECKYIKQMADAFELKNEIDTISLKKDISDEYKPNIRQEYFSKNNSSKEVFEHLNHLKFVNKYDYIYSYYGPGAHTLYPEIVLLKVASMLTIGGIARIHINGKDPNNIIENIHQYLNTKKQANTCIFTPEYHSKIDNWIEIKRVK